MNLIDTMLHNVVKVFKIQYKILDYLEEKGYSVDDSPSSYVYKVEDKVYMFDLSNTNVTKEQLGNIITLSLSLINDTVRACKENSDKDTSKYDVLTGVYNRAYFEEQLKTLSNVVLIAGDVNNLKVTNDVFGHKEGDELLITASRLLKKYAKPEYIIARCGGDEFNIIIPNGTVKEAKEYCDNIQKDCKAYVGNLHLKPQIAFGYAKQNDNENMDDTFKRADDFMYKNKTYLKERSDVIKELELKMYELGYASKEEMMKKLKLAFSFGLHLGLSLSTLADLTIAIKIEEIGMLTVAPEIKFKEGELTDDEMKEIKKHPEVGFRLAKLDNSTLRVAQTIYQCHENFDGTGYPCGIQGEQIDYLARIIALITGYSAAYEKHKSKGEDIAFMEAINDINSSSVYDAIIKRQFIEYLEESRDIRQKGELNQ